jgi:hypothetical protein
MKKITCFALAASMVALAGCSNNGSGIANNPSDASQSGAGGALTTGGASSGTGGASTGGSANSGGSASTGGSESLGGMSSGSGGASATGGATATGGVSPSGGSAATGGVKTTGGATANGGISANGGATRTGGNTASGGVSGTGGAADAGRDLAVSTGGAMDATGTAGEAGTLAGESASFHCFNWADAGDNFQTGALVLTGLAATDTYDTILAKSNAIISGFKTVLGANAFRMPINETTVNTATTWAAYKGIFDAAISQNVKVIVAYWLPPGSNHIANTTTWNTMWQTVVNTYVTSDLVYFDVFNEPSGYSAQAFITLVQQWMAANPSVPANRVIVAGTTTDIDVNQQGAALPDCLLSLHIYDSVGNTVAAAENAVKTHAGPYYDRTIVTEYTGASLFMQGITTQMKAYGMGSCYWAGLEGTGGIAKVNGTGTNLTLTANNAATLATIQSGWTQ